MLCQNCKKNTATVFYKETINGNTNSYALCPECAAKLKQQGKIQSSITDYDPFAGFFSAPFTDLLSNFIGISDQEPAFKNEACPNCGYTLSMISQTGMTGCPKCYAYFSEALEPTIRSIHGNAKHVGRIPSRFQKKQEKKNQLAQLKKQLEEAIKKEEFENAAKLRDQIRTLEKGNDAGESA